jgi:cytochrome c-type biogenesis protein CcmH/NrfG
VVSALIVLLIAALITSAAGFWVLRAYRRAGGGARTAGPALVACAAGAIAALVAYLAVGRPEMPGAAYAARLEALKYRDPTTYTADEALAVLAEAARDDPRDAQPHFYSGEVLLNMGRAQEAAREYDAALRRQPQHPEAMLGLGRALVRIDGRVTPEALALFQQAGALTNDPTPWIYQAMAAIEENRVADERRFWGEALQRMSPDDPRRAMAERMSRGDR